MRAYILGIAPKNKKEIEFFNEVEKLHRDSYEVVNPLSFEIIAETEEEQQTDLIITKVIEIMNCDVIFLLPNWLESNMAKVLVCLILEKKKRPKFLDAQTLEEVELLTKTILFSVRHHKSYKK